MTTSPIPVSDSPEADAPNLTLVSAKATPAPSPWLRIGDFGVLGLWISIVGFTLHYHEKWADEAQAWLIARDLPLSRIWFYELRYEGTPGLWHTILWIAQHVFHLRYDSIGLIGMAGATAGVALLIFKAPFPRYIRWPLAFTYFMVYQYAVIARSYCFFALFCLLAARQFRNSKRPGLFALSLIPLANLTAHGSVLAASWAFAYGLRFVRRWRETDSITRRTFLISAIGVTLMYVFLFLVLFPPADVEATHQEAITRTVFLHRTLGVIGGALVDYGWLSVSLLCVLGIWCYLRKSLLILLLPVILLVFLYVYTAGWPHYQGTVFLTILGALVISWPDEAEVRIIQTSQMWSYRAVIAVLAITISYQIYAAFVATGNEVNLPYSGAGDAAQYLKPAVEQGKVICGYQYGMVAINSYFDHNIFANWPRSYYHHSVSEFDPALVAEQVRTSGADYIVTNWWDPLWDEKAFDEGLRAPLQTWGYSLAHTSDGYLLTKTGYSRRQIYLIFKKM